jgi:tetratricopeptide (TPR) repeat protein
MRDTISCPACNRQLDLPTEYLGQEVQCPQCAATFVAGTLPPPAAPVVNPSEAIAPLAPSDSLPPINLEIDAPSKEASRSRRPKLAPYGSNTSAGKPLVRKPVVILGAIILGVACCTCSMTRWNPWLEPRDHGRNDLAFPGNRPGPGERGMPVNADDPKAQMAELFARFARLVKEGDRHGLAALVDSSEMAAGGGEQDLILADIFIRDPERVFSAPNRIRHVRESPDGNLVVITAHRRGNKEIGLHRWWVNKRAGLWRIADQENLHFCIPLSATVGANRENIGRQNDIATLNNATNFLVENRNSEEAERLLKTVRPGVLPRRMLGTYHHLQAVTHMIRGRHQECLNACDEALAAHPDLPRSHVLRAISLSGLGKYELALEAARKAQTMLGDDPAAFYEVGLALAGLGKFSEAAAAYRQSLDEEPDQPLTFQSLVRAAGPDIDPLDFGDRFARLENPQNHFNENARDLWARFQAKHLEQLALAMRRIDPRHADAARYLALAQAEQSQFPKALASFGAALELQPVEARRREYYHEFAKVLAFRDHAVAAYAQLPDIDLAFLALAAALRQNGKNDDLNELVERHAVKRPKDPVILLYKADALVQEEKFVEASKAYAASFARITDEIVLGAHRHSYVLARYRTGDLVGAYRDIPPRQSTFDQLAQLCWADRKADELQRLVDAHARSDAGDPALNRARWRIHILKGRFAEAGKLVKRAPMDPAENNRIVLEDFIFDMIELNHPVEAYRHCPDRALAFDILGQEWNGANRQALIEERRKDAPEDPLIEIHLANAAKRARDWKKAAAHFEAGWSKMKDADRPRWTHAYLYASYKAGQPMRAYQATRKERFAFNSLAGILINDKNADAFEKLVAERRLEKAGDPELDAYEARVLVLHGKLPEAEALLARCCAKAPEFERKRLIETFVSDLAQLGRPVDAYRCAPDKIIAFQHVVWRLRDVKQLADLERLIEEHARHHPGDRRLALERGELALLKDDLPLAEKQFTLAKQKANADELNAARLGLVRTRIRMGRAVETYQELGPGTATFQEIANQCFFVKNADQLERLLASHRKAFPAAKNLAAWDVEVLWLKKDYQAVADAIQAQRAALLKTSPHRWKCERLLVHSLVQLKNYKEAIREAEELNRAKYGPRVLLAYALAASGDVPATIAYLEKNAVEREFLVEDCYFDEYLGPILRSESFADFRKQFPEPPKH